MSSTITDQKVVSRGQWLEARKALLTEEKALTRKRDELARKRRELPWVQIEKQYVFEGPQGKVMLADLFGDRSQLVVYHFMFGPEWQEGCPSCSFGMDHIGGTLVHLAQRDVAFITISRAPWAKIAKFKERMGWKFPWVSSYESDFNWEFRVSFKKDELADANRYNFGTSSHPGEEAPGISVFYKDENGDVFHTYSTYGRGLEPIITTYDLLDMTPKGRDEDGLYFPMAWIRHHDRYETGQLADADRPYWPSEPQTVDKAKTTDHACCSEAKSA
jgi:predicted dithiol-disulfide oxidoreductase (DUF899 family)